MDVVLKRFAQLLLDGLPGVAQIVHLLRTLQLYGGVTLGTRGEGEEEYRL